MFAVEVDFHDGVSPPELLHVRRPFAVIGSGESAHVILEGAAATLGGVRLYRELGRSFRCRPVASDEASSQQSMDSSFQGFAELNLGELSLRIISIDEDLRLDSELSPDEAAVRVIREALSKPSPVFPAAMLLSSTPIIFSFRPDRPLLIGRSRECSLRLETPDISAEHARIGFSEGAAWVEDLASTNGTYIDGRVIKGRQPFESGQVLRLGGECQLALVMCAADIENLQVNCHYQYETSADTPSFPCVVSSSELVRPNSLVLKPGKTVTLGRDPASDIWIGAPHISRCHAEIRMNNENEVDFIDLSSNGSFIGDFRLPKGEPYRVVPTYTAIDLSEGLMLEFCFSEADRELLSEKQGQESPAKEVVGPTPGFEHTALLERLDVATEEIPEISVSRSEAAVPPTPEPSSHYSGLGGLGEKTKSGSRIYRRRRLLALAIGLALIGGLVLSVLIFYG